MSESIMVIVNNHSDDINTYCELFVKEIARALQVPTDQLFANPSTVVIHKGQAMGKSEVLKPMYGLSPLLEFMGPSRD